MLLRGTYVKRFLSQRHVGDTIFALATAAGRAGVGIIRVSGPETAEVLLLGEGGRREGNFRMYPLILYQVNRSFPNY